MSPSAAFLPRTFCSDPAASRSRWRGSTSSASATPRVRWRSHVTPSTRRASMRRPASSSAVRCASSGLQWKFADMAIKLEGAQLLLYRAAANADRGLPSAYETAIAKAACNQAGFEVASEAVQIMGATGYSQESLVEWCMRRCRGWMIAGGSIEILKNRIAEHLFDRRFDQRRPKPAEAAE